MEPASDSPGLEPLEHGVSPLRRTDGTTTYAGRRPVGCFAGIS